MHSVLIYINYAWTKFSLEKYNSLYESLRTCKLHVFSKGGVLFEQIVINVSI